MSYQRTSYEPEAIGLDVSAGANQSVVGLPPIPPASSVGWHRRGRRTTASIERASFEIEVAPPRADCYVSVDIATDGPIPGRYSMLSFALVTAGRYDGQDFARPDIVADTFYVELKPISTHFDPEAMRVNGMDREELFATGAAPKDAMRDAAQWVREIAGKDRAVLVAYPVAFDWSFLFWYFIRWCRDSPFGYSSCLDIRTLYQAKARTVHDCSGKQSMPAWLLTSAPHTHNALDDAREQAELFANVFEYVLDLRGPGSASPQSALQAGRS